MIDDAPYDSHLSTVAYQLKLKIAEEHSKRMKVAVHHLRTGNHRELVLMLPELEDLQKQIRQADVAWRKTVASPNKERP